MQALGYRLTLAFKWRMVLIALRGAGLVLIAFSEIFFLNERASLFLFSFSNKRVQETIFFDTCILKMHPCKIDSFLATMFCFIIGVKNKKVVLIGFNSFDLPMGCFFLGLGTISTCDVWPHLFASFICC